MTLHRDTTSFLDYISYFLSVVTISICFILKIPQIVTVLKVKSAKGINVIGLLMELVSYTVMMSYNYRNGYAILSYLEYPIILVQEIILIVCVLKLKNMLNTSSFIIAAIYILIAISFLTGIAPLGLLTFLVPLCTPVSVSSKVVQLAEILRTKNSESISVLTWFISAFTNFTRVFTILMESMDFTLLLNFSVNTLLSTSVMLAAYFYKHPKKD